LTHTKSLGTGVVAISAFAMTKSPEPPSITPQTEICPVYINVSTKKPAILKTQDGSHLIIVTRADESDNSGCIPRALGATEIDGVAFPITEGLSGLVVDPSILEKQASTINPVAKKLTVEQFIQNLQR
jgi:hypothetical protein